MEALATVRRQIVSRQSWHQPAITLAVSGLLIVLGQVVQPGFADYGQIMNILRITAFLGIVSAGQTLVVLSGGEGIDLSVGSTVTLSAVLAY
jgi:ribose transport system permease protein